MVPYHQAHFILMGRGYLVEKTLDWFLEILPKAKANAARNGYKGARWPKMIDPEAFDSPSIIAPLLVWQQPHILYMLELLRESRYGKTPVEETYGISECAFLEKYKPLVLETAVFMADYVVYHAEKGVYEILPPVIPVQENHPPRITKNPSFEVAYWRFGLKVAYEWLQALGETHPEFLEVSQKMAPVHIADGLIEAHENCTETYTKYNTDHPSMLYSYGMLSDEIDETVLLHSLDTFRKGWNLVSMWGWDFAMLAMIYEKLGKSGDAYDMLLWETEKNAYVVSGNNAQLSRTDLPLYLPGNGSLLMAMSLLGNSDTFTVEKEGVMEYPF